MVTVVVPEIELLADTDAVLEPLRVALVEAVGVCSMIRSGAPVGRRHRDRVAHIARRSCMTCSLIAAVGLLGRRLVRFGAPPRRSRYPSMRQIKAGNSVAAQDN